MATTISPLKAGQQAPSFSAPDQHGNTRTLEEFKGSKLVLYFYPKDNTPGCTVQACNLNDNLATLSKAGYKVLGVSKDPAKSHLKFIDKFGLQFDLLCDEEAGCPQRLWRVGAEKIHGARIRWHAPHYVCH